MFAKKGNMSHAFLERWNLDVCGMCQKDKNVAKNRTEESCKNVYRHSKIKSFGDKTWHLKRLKIFLLF